ncbi:MAG TPA: carboxypeptidase regulatory-like domain-containing protein [Bryobacteraceae bacterium]|nr:carboxypeptidase regulatory-like domain-containing protein [Bryobacteraceae bacterium]
MLLRVVLPAFLVAQTALLSQQNGVLGGIIGDGSPRTAARTVSSDCTLDGTVVNSISGEPVPRARVLLLSPLGQNSMTSDSGGRFRFANASCGRVQFMASRTGYLQNNPGGPMPGGPGPVVNLESGGSAHDVRLPLTPQAVVTGTVTDDQGDPVMNAQVSVMASRIVQGKRGFQQIAAGTTNDLGEYRIPGLAAGKTIVCAQVNPGTMPVDSGALTTDQRCYPGPIDGGLASTLDLLPGRDVRVNIALPQVASVHVRGVITGLPKTRGVGVSLVRRGATGNPPARPAAMNPDGRFDIRGVTPGSYLLTTDYWEANKRYTARVPVDVGGADVENVSVVLAEAFTVSGIVRIESTKQTEPPRPAQMGISLRSSEPMAGGGRLQWSPDGTSFSLLDMTPGTYRLESFVGAGGLYIKRAMLNGRDLSREEMQINQQTGPIELVLSDDGGKIEGNVESHDGKPLTTWVMLYEDGRAPRNLRSDDAGHFALQNIAPGTYNVYAWDDISRVEYGNPDWMRRNATGEKVTVQPGQTARVRLVEVQTSAQ